MLKYYIPLLVAILVTGLAFCQETELKSTKAKAAVRDYERKIEDVDEDFEKQLKDLEKSYQMKSEILRARLLSNLNAAMEEEAKRVRLEEATEIKELIKQRKETELPTLEELMGRSKVIASKKTKGKFRRDAVQHGNHFYYLVTERRTWHQAERAAIAAGGYLVRLNSTAEHDFIISWLKQSKCDAGVHIDGTRFLDGDTFLFSDGKKMPLSLLRTGLIKDYPNKSWEQFLFLNSKGFKVDSFHLHNFYFIIEWDK